MVLRSWRTEGGDDEGRRLRGCELQGGDEEKGGGEEETRRGGDEEGRRRRG